MGTTNYTNVTNCDARILRLAPRMTTNLVSLCVIANAVKQSREKMSGKQLVWIASFLAMTRSGLLDSLISAKRVVGLPPAPLKRGTRKATRNLGPAGPPRRGDTLLTVGRDLRQHPGRPASGRLPPLEGVPAGRGSQKTPAGKF